MAEKQPEGSPVDYARPSLDDILEGKSAEELTKQPEAKEPEKDEAKDEEPRKGEGEDEGKAPEPRPEKEAEESAEDAPPASDPGEKLVPLSALEDERKKRQKAFERLDELEKRLEDVQRKPRPDEFMDPDGAAAWDREESERRAEAETVKQRDERIASSQEIMREIHEDYDEMEAVFAEAAERDRSLAVQMVNHPAPAKFAYQKGKELKMLKDIGDPASYRERIKAEVLAELEAKGHDMGEKPKKPDAPPSLADAPAAHSNREGEKWDGPTPLDDILAGVGKT